MSRQTARIVLDQLNARPALIASRYAAGAAVHAELTSVSLLGDVRELARADVDQLEGAQVRRRQELAAAYGYEDNTPAKPFVFASGKAIIPVHGLLLNRFPYSWGFATGYNFIRAQVEAAMNDPDVDGIVYDVNTYGGLVTGCQETSDMMFASSARQGGKRSLAVVDANCYSAGYYLASAADRITVTPSGGAGSIGVVLMHMDLSKMLDEIGVKVTFIYAGDHKVDGNAYEPLSEEVAADLKAEIDKMYDKFVGTVTRNRTSMSEQAVRDTQARCYQADDALAVGLIDAVQTPPDALEAYFNADDAGEDDEQPDDPEPDDIEVSTEREDNDMADKQTSQPAANPPAATGPTAEETAAAARIAERDRIKAILALPEAEGRTDLANHLALTTDMTPEAAKGILNASPKAAPPAAQAPESKQENQPNYFKQAMDNGKQPNVGSGPKGEGEGEDGEPGKPSRAQQVIALQERVQGKPKQSGRAA